MANSWSVVDRLPLSLGDDGEMLARATAVQIADNLPAQCALQDALWEQRDIDFSASLGVPHRRTRVAVVPRERVFLGAQPSLVESPGERWPAITVRADSRVPSSDREQADQYESWDVTLIVEVHACAGPFLEVIEDRGPSDEIDRQYQRLAAATHASIRVDPTLGGTTFEIKRPPRIRPSLPMARKTDKGAGQQLLLQLMELTYVATSLSI